MKTPPLMVIFLPRFRWFVWGFGLCAAMYGFIDGYFSMGIPILLLLGAVTYISESVNRGLMEANAALAMVERDTEVRKGR